MFKYILEVVFCEGVQHHPQFCLDHLSCVKTAAFQLYLHLGQQRKVRQVEGDSYVVFLSKRGPFNFVFSQGNRKVE
jgi:hypothetical protein